jgi:MFS family permease
MVPSERGFGAVLRNRHFLLLWLAQATSQIAQNGANLVQIVLIETLTHSSGQIALMVLAFSLPGALLSLLAGVVVDRVSNRLILVASNALRVLFTLGYFGALHVLSDWPALIVIYLLTFCNSAIGQFFAPAEAATIPALVQRESLLSANALFNLTMTVAQLVGLIMVFPVVLKFGNTLGPNRGIDIAFGLVAMLYAIAAALVVFLPADRRRYHPERVTTFRATLRDIREGWRYVHSNPSIYLPMLHLTVVAMLVMVLVTIGPGFASRVLGLAPEDAVFIFGPAGAGMLVSTLVIGRFGQRARRDRLSNLGQLAISLVLGGLAAVGWISDSARSGTFFSGLNYLPIVMVLSVALGASVALIAIPAQTSLQERAPVDLRGRVFALLYTLTSLVVIGPLIFIGALADQIGIPNVTLLVALATAAAGIFGMMRGRHLAPPTLEAAKPA